MGGAGFTGEFGIGVQDSLGNLGWVVQDSLGEFGMGIQDSSLGNLSRGSGFAVIHIGMQYFLAERMPNFLGDFTRGCQSSRGGGGASL